MNELLLDIQRIADDRITLVWQAKNMVDDETKRIARKVEVLTRKIDNFDGNEQNHRREKAKLLFQLPFVLTHKKEFEDHQSSCFATNSFCVDCVCRAERLLGAKP